MRLFQVTTLAIIITSAAACRTPDADQGSETLNVFGDDDRQLWNSANTSEAFPFHSIGRLSVGCTGAVVSSRLILTAAHCVANYSIGDNIQYRHHSSDGSEDYQNTQLLARGSSAANPFNQEYDDWALLLLASPTSHQRFRVWAFGSNESQMVLNQPAWLVGYSHDLPDAAVATKCAVRARQNGVLYHDCDIQGGASGGPMYIKNAAGERLIIGVQSSHTFCNDGPCSNGIDFNMATANRAVDTLSFLQQFMSYYQTYP